jgi:hypothetical protein
MTRLRRPRYESGRVFPLAAILGCNQRKWPVLDLRVAGFRTGWAIPANAAKSVLTYADDVRATAT